MVAFCQLCFKEMMTMMMITVLLTSGEGKDRSFNELLNDLSFPSPNDVIRLREIKLQQICKKKDPFSVYITHGGANIEPFTTVSQKRCQIFHKVV